MHIHPIDALTK